jgi:hypothetical protein
MTCEGVVCGIADGCVSTPALTTNKGELMIVSEVTNAAPKLDLGRQGAYLRGRIAAPIIDSKYCEPL